MKSKTHQKIRSELAKDRKHGKERVLARFFKTGKGEYGEGDKFLGLTMPQIRLVVNTCWKDCDINSAVRLMQDRYHEIRMAGILILVKKFERTRDEKEKEKIVRIYLDNRKYVNNWDLVDLSAPNIFGRYFFGKETDILDRLLKSPILWDRRIAVLSTFWFIRQGEFGKSLEYAEKLLTDREDLIHKAVGWMLRETGKRDKKTLTDFLDKHSGVMPRTMLRYSIEKFPEEERQKFLKKN
jgi:3-methyladenine DNA glycosylase AlkD